MTAQGQEIADPVREVHVNITDPDPEPDEDPDEEPPWGGGDEDGP